MPGLVPHGCSGTLSLAWMLTESCRDVMSMSATELAQPEKLEPQTEAPSMVAPEDEPELVIKPHRGWIGVDWRELMSHRELLFFLVWRDVKVKYKQAILGVAWAVFVPLISVMLFTFVGKAAGFDSKVSGTITLKDGTVMSGGLVKSPDAWL